MPAASSRRPRQLPRLLEQLGARVLTRPPRPAAPRRPSRAVVGEPLRHDDLDLGQQVAGAVPWPATPRPLTRSTRPLGVPGATLTRTGVPSRVGHRHGGAEGGLGEGDRQVDGEVVAVAAEHRVLVDGDGEDQVARRPRRGRPAAPLPRSRIFCPSLTPAGIRVVIRAPLGRLQGDGRAPSTASRKRQRRPRLHVAPLARAGAARRSRRTGRRRTPRHRRRRAAGPPNICASRSSRSGWPATRHRAGAAGGEADPLAALPPPNGAEKMSSKPAGRHPGPRRVKRAPPCAMAGRRRTRWRCSGSESTA